jgi:hypothetical protein
MNLENQPMKKQIEALDHLNDLAWEISTAMKIVQIHKDDVIKYALEPNYVKIRVKGLEEAEKELEDLQNKYDLALAYLNNLNK